ncbi:MAG: quinohemoprotein amine dehydrogenase subunit alpha, partial [Bryobacterales bacterium]|nr:quinohemoprotein amine dehydrogenase subunit alpha [Bryobacterales bacterium]
PEANDGIPVTSDVVKNSCGGCHKTDDKGRMSRISYRRTTPEGWEHTVRRMVSLNSVKLTPEVARTVVRYLADHHGLAPEEARAGAFEVEKRLIEYKYAADVDTEQTCIKCHSFGRVLMQRRTKEEWELLLAMHRGFYPLVDFQAFRRMGPAQTQPGPDGRPPDNRHPMEKAISHLASAFPLRTPEWSAWSVNIPQQQVAGRWALSGYQAGKGPFHGEYLVRQEQDSILTEARFTWARTGAKEERKGRAVLYTGFQWRGRNMATGPDSAMREVMFVERNQKEMSGRWFTGGYDEIGMDVRLERIGRDAMVLGVDTPRLPQGASGAKLVIYGVGLPSSGVLSLGAGISAKILEGTAERVIATVNVDASAPTGYRDLHFAGAVKQNALAVYGKIDGLKVRPLAGLARVGGIRFPKQLQQFEAIAFSNGPDDKPDTKDDVELGAVEVTWSVEEFTATFRDDDRQFSGTLDGNGLFTPAVDGPNDRRSGNRNNIGDLWIVATHNAGGKTLRARAHLLVAPPVYMRFDMGGMDASGGAQ